MDVSSVKLSTRRLDLTPLGPEDAALVRHFFQDPDIRFHFFGDEHPPEIQVTRFLREALERRSGEARGLWLAVERQSQAHVGFGGLVALPYAPFPEVHLAVDREFRHRGYGTEIAQRLLWYALYQQDFKIVLASVEHTNDPAIRLLLNCGMRLNKIFAMKGRWYHQFALLQCN